MHGMDYPGFGMSEGLHGYIPNFNDLVDDVAYQYRKIIGEPTIPVQLLLAYLQIVLLVILGSC